MRLFRTASGFAIALLVVGPAHAQDLPSDIPPAHLAVVDGSASLTRENERDDAIPGTPLVEGDRLRTDRGRAEILFPDGSALALDEYSTLELLSPTLFRLSEGRVVLSVAGANNPAAAVHFVIDTPTASAETHGPGEFRLSLLPSPSGLETELWVARGSATLTNDRGRMPLASAQRSVASDNAPPSYPQVFNSARFDAFDRWASALRDDRLGRLSSQYLPADLRMYSGVLDRSGSWQYESSYGYVWLPNVASDWRPYDDGYWSPVPSYGWTWIGVNTWSWPTHHYGRWGYERSRWFWIPERHWAPAWVSWGAAPGYVSWSPLGFDNRPVFGLSVSSRDSWAGWTVMSRNHFDGARRNAREYAVPGRALPPNTPFVMQRTAPPPPPRSAVRRSIVGTQATRANGAASESPSSTSSSSGFARPRAATPSTPVDRGRPGAPSRRADEPGAAQLPGRQAGERDRWRTPSPPEPAAPSAPRERGSAGAVLRYPPRDAGSSDVAVQPAPAPRRLPPIQPADGSAPPAPPARARGTAIYSTPAPTPPSAPREQEEPREGGAIRRSPSASSTAQPTPPVRQSSEEGRAAERRAAPRAAPSREGGSAAPAPSARESQGSNNENARGHGSRRAR